MAWWIWIAAGVVLAGLEMLAGGELWLLFAGVAAIVVGLLAGVGVTGLGAQLLVFSVLAVSAFFLRRRLLKPTGAEPVGSESLVGELGTATSPILPGKTGDAEFRGLPLACPDGFRESHRIGRRRAGGPHGGHHALRGARMKPRRHRARQGGRGR